MNPQFKIMSAVDLSGYSEFCVRYCLWLVRKLDAKLIMVNVINQRDLDIVERAMAGYGAFSFPDYLAEQVEFRRKKMKELFKTGDLEDDQFHCRIPHGVPYQEILSAIEQEKPDLLVLGTKGRSNFTDVIVGSTARKLYRRSPIPMITIPAGYRHLPDQPND